MATGDKRIAERHDVALTGDVDVLLYPAMLRSRLFTPLPYLVSPATATTV